MSLTTATSKFFRNKIFLISFFNKRNIEDLYHLAFYVLKYYSYAQAEDRKGLYSTDLYLMSRYIKCYLVDTLVKNVLQKMLVLN